MIGFAANHEDVRLARVFNEASGLFVDVGANHPTVGSVTRHFYDRGWRGINVEPSPAMFSLLEAQRPKDRNIRAAAGAAIGTAHLHFFGDAPGLSTTVDRIADDHALMLGAPERHEVPVTTLAAICAEHVAGEIDFMVIDVEGAEMDVLAGADFDRFRPRVVVVEATKPLSREPTHEVWEPILTRNSYIPTAFDGCNRFYVAEEAAACAPTIAAPLCSFDRYVDYGTIELARALCGSVDANADPYAIVEAVSEMNLEGARSWLARAR